MLLQNQVKEFIDKELDFLGTQEMKAAYLVFVSLVKSKRQLELVHNEAFPGECQLLLPELKKLKKLWDLLNPDENKNEESISGFGIAKICATFDFIRQDQNLREYYIQKLIESMGLEEHDREFVGDWVLPPQKFGKLFELIDKDYYRCIMPRERKIELMMSGATLFLTVYSASVNRRFVCWIDVSEKELNHDLTEHLLSLPKWDYAWKHKTMGHGDISLGYIVEDDESGLLEKSREFEGEIPGSWGIVITNDSVAIIEKMLRDKGLKFRSLRLIDASLKKQKML